MDGIEIHDMDPGGFLAFDLREIVRCLGDDVTSRNWRCATLECTGDATKELESIARSREVITGERLVALAERTFQVVNGDFFGRLPGEQQDSLRIRAIDSSLWEVFGDDASLAKVRATFTDLQPAVPDLD